MLWLLSAAPLSATLLLLPTSMVCVTRYSMLLPLTLIAVTIRCPDLATASGKVRARVDPPLLRFTVVCCVPRVIGVERRRRAETGWRGLREASPPPCVPPVLCEHRGIGVPAGAFLGPGVICGVEAPTYLRTRYDLWYLWYCCCNPLRS